MKPNTTFPIAAILLLAILPPPLAVLHAAEEEPPRYDADHPKPGAPIDTEKLRRLAWGPPATNGLRVACYFEPTREAYADGEVRFRIAEKAPAAQSPDNPLGLPDETLRKLYESGQSLRQIFRSVQTYCFEKQHLPEHIEDLLKPTPYLGKIPSDPFGTGPLRWVVDPRKAPGRARVYSVGPDGKWDNGQSIDSSQSALIGDLGAEFDLRDGAFRFLADSTFTGYLEGRRLAQYVAEPTAKSGSALLAVPASALALRDGAAILSAMAAIDDQLALGGVTLEGTKVSLPGKIRSPGGQRLGKIGFSSSESRWSGPATKSKWKFTCVSDNQIAYDEEVVEVLRWEDWMPAGPSLPEPGDEPTWMTMRLLSFLGPEASGHYDFVGIASFEPEVWPARRKQVHDKVSFGSLRLYAPNPGTLSAYLDLPLLLVGRGYAQHIRSVTSVEALAGGRLSVKAEGKPFYARATKWDLVVEPAAAYLVRSAAYYVDDSDRTLAKPRYVITTSGLQWFGPLALPEKFDQRDPAGDKERPFQKSGTVTTASLRSDRHFFKETADLCKAPFPISTDFQDNRMRPPSLLQFRSGEFLDRNLKPWPMAPLEGVVTDPQGHPVAGASVYLLSKVFPVQTDEQGRFVLAVAPSDRDYDLFAVSPKKDLAALVHLKTGTQTTTIPLEPTRDFTGEVTTEAGLPAGGLRFALALRSKLNGQDILRVNQEILTDTTGKFTVANLCPKATYSASWKREDERNLKCEPGHAELDLTQVTGSEPMRFRVRQLP